MGNNANEAPLGRTDFWYKELLKSYVGDRTAHGVSPGDPAKQVFACPSDFGWPALQGGKKAAYFKNAGVDFNSYIANPNLVWDSSTITSVSGVSTPTRFVLIAEFAACAPFSWHKFQPGYDASVTDVAPIDQLVDSRHPNAGLFDNALGSFVFIDGHAQFAKMRWDTNNYAWNVPQPGGSDATWK